MLSVYTRHRPDCKLPVAGWEDTRKVIGVSRREVKSNALHRR